MLALLALGACRQPPAPPPQTAPTPADVASSHDASVATSDASTAAVVDAPSAASQRLLALAGETAQRMATIRGLTLDGPVRRGVMTRAQILARLREKTAREYPPGEIALEGALYAALGFIPGDMDYERTMFDLLEEQVAGFYDPDDRTFYIAEWLPAAAQPVTMAHELTHALQDQHFHIGRFTHHERGHGDAQSAAMAVIEGDATTAMLDYALAPAGRRARDLPNVLEMVASQLSGDDQQRLRDAPRALRETLLFPYLAGLELCVRTQRRGGGYEGVDALLANPPASTEQVLHDDKLQAREAPVEVPARVPAALAAEWDLAYQDVLGELGARLFFYTGVDDARARTAAQGWGGDRAVLLAPRGAVHGTADGGAPLDAATLAAAPMLWTVALDAVPHATGPAADREAVEFAEAAVAVLGRRHASAPPVTIPGALAARDLGGGRVALVARAGRRVLVAERLPRASAAAVLRQSLLP